jgi:hypothetical protein
MSNWKDNNFYSFKHILFQDLYFKQNGIYDISLIICVDNVVIYVML